MSIRYKEAVAEAAEALYRESTEGSKGDDRVRSIFDDKGPTGGTYGTRYVAYLIERIIWHGDWHGISDIDAAWIESACQEAQRYAIDNDPSGIGGLVYNEQYGTTLIRPKLTRDELLGLCRPADYAI